MEIDLCVGLAGMNLDVYTPLFFESLYRNCDTSKLAVHAVEKGAIVPPEDAPETWFTHLPIEYYVPGVGDNVHEYLLRKQKEVTTPFTIYEKHNPSEFFSKAKPGKPSWELGADYSNTLNWMMENCGSNKWAIFCHLDMIFLGDIITRFRSETFRPDDPNFPGANFMLGDVGAFGIYANCFAVNREAYFKVGIRFNDVASFWLLPVNHNGFDYELRHNRDPRCDYLQGGDRGDAKRLYGFDILELMEVMMVANHWHCDISEVHPFRSSLDHMCSGHGYVPEETARHQETRRQYWMELLDVQKV